MREQLHLPVLGRYERTTRMLYKSGLGFYCINHVQGCSHGCKYPCYAYMLAKRHGRVHDYLDWCRPRLVDNAVSLLERELRNKRTRIPSVQLCLTTDPFMYGYPEVAERTLAIVELLNRYRIPCSLHTKGVLPAALADRKRFPMDNKHTISLVSLDEPFREKWEPRAAPFAERIAALRRLHEAGRRTRVHMEPYPTPNIIEQDLLPILESVSFVDNVFLSGWNYNAAVAYPQADSFYQEQVAIAGAFFEQRKSKQGYRGANQRG